MTLESVLVWAFVGLIAGWLAAKFTGGGLGVIGDIVVGIIGSFLGSFIFRELGWHSPLAGIAGTIFVAFLGALALLVVFRVVLRGRRN